MATNISIHPSSTLHSQAPGNKIKSSHHYHFETSISTPIAVALAPSSTTTSNTETLNTNLSNQKMAVPGSTVRGININDSSKLISKRINGQTITPITLNNGTQNGANVITLSHIKAAFSAAAASPNNPIPLGTLANSGNNFVIYNIKTDTSDPSKQTLYLTKNSTLMANNLQSSPVLKYIANPATNQQESETKPLIIYPQVGNLSSSISNSVTSNGNAAYTFVSNSSSTTNNINNRCSNGNSTKKVKLEIKEEPNVLTNATPLASSVNTNKPICITKLMETTNEFVDGKMTAVNSKSPEILAKTVSKSNIENCLPVSCNNSHSTNNHFNRLPLNPYSNSKFYYLNKITPYLPDEIFDSDEEDFCDDEVSNTKPNVELPVSSTTTTTVTNEESQYIKPKVDLSNGVDPQHEKQSSTLPSIVTIKEEIDEVETKLIPLTPNVPTVKNARIINSNNKKKEILTPVTKIGSGIQKISTPKTKPMSISHIVTSMGGNGSVQITTKTSLKPNSCGKVAIIKAPNKVQTNGKSFTKISDQMTYQQKRAQIWQILIKEISYRKQQMDQTKALAMEKRRLLSYECETYVHKRSIATNSSKVVVVKRRPSITKATSQKINGSTAIITNANLTSKPSSAQSSSQQRTITFHLTPNQLNNISSSLLFVSKNSTSGTSTTAVSGASRFVSNGNGTKMITLTSNSFPMILTTANGTTLKASTNLTTKRPNQSSSQHHTLTLT